ncbi:MAG: hypothetical protein IJR35_06755 [Synergistaceae bacterium]|nr:hypothetical protein [Synergistaceae bacterium]MBQ9404814.1 hypothetical protein [Synergistaceae bacterium]MBQ9595545.1 hypothetical protein [Synergistaceae bacterium]
MLKKFLPFLVVLLVSFFASCSFAETYYVINSHSKSTYEAPGSLSWAVSNVNALGGEGHIIEFEEGVKSITLTKELTINAGVTINGDGVCITGAGNSRLFNVTKGKVEFNQITFTKGYAIENNGGAVNIEGPEASAEFTNCTFYENTADNFGGAVCVTNGSDKNVTVFTNCRISDNDALNGGGVAVIKGDAKIFASIITGNSDKELYTGEKATLTNSNNIFNDYEVSYKK